MLDIEPRQQQGEFLAAIPGNDQSLVECDQRQGFADRPQTGVALDVAITIIEQLEVIDIDHDQSERLAQFIRVAPGMIQFAIEAAPVGKAGKAVEARQFLQMLIGDLQLFLARRELARPYRRTRPRVARTPPSTVRRPRAPADRRGRSAWRSVPAMGSAAE